MGVVRWVHRKDNILRVEIARKDRVFVDGEPRMHEVRLKCYAQGRLATILEQYFWTHHWVLFEGHIASNKNDGAILWVKRFSAIPTSRESRAKGAQRLRRNQSQIDLANIPVDDLAEDGDIRGLEE